MMRVYRKIKNALAGALATPTSSALLDALLQIELSRELERLQNELRVAMPENPAVAGFKVYSQADEDGILEEISRRLNLTHGTFIEIGCGDGRENNTHYLLLKRWSGIWVDGDSANLAAIRLAVPLDKRLRAIEQVVTRENVKSIPEAAGTPLGNLDLFSVDVDGNDLAIALEAVDAWAPKIIVGEYNAKFRFPLEVGVTYQPMHRWRGDDYHGSSLGAWVAQLKPLYQLVACNLAGTNAFFVRSDLAGNFGTYSPDQLYQPARFHFTALRSGHAPSLSFLKNSLENEAGQLDLRRR